MSQMKDVIPGVAEHKELTPSQIEQARQVIENLEYKQVNDQFGVDFSHLHEGSQGNVIFVYGLTEQDQTFNWVAFKLVYVDSGQDIEQLPDPEL